MSPPRSTRKRGTGRGSRVCRLKADALAVTDEDERQRALALYRAKFPFVNDKFADLIAQSVVYVLRPALDSLAG